MSTHSTPSTGQSNAPTKAFSTVLVDYFLSKQHLPQPWYQPDSLAQIHAASADTVLAMLESRSAFSEDQDSCLPSTSLDVVPSGGEHLGAPIVTTGPKHDDGETAQRSPDISHKSTLSNADDQVDVTLPISNDEIEDSLSKSTDILKKLAIGLGKAAEIRNERDRRALETKLPDTKNGLLNHGTSLLNSRSRMAELDAILGFSINKVQSQQAEEDAVLPKLGKKTYPTGTYAQQLCGDVGVVFRRPGNSHHDSHQEKTSNVKPAFNSEASTAESAYAATRLRNLEADRKRRETEASIQNVLNEVFDDSLNDFWAFGQPPRRLAEAQAQNNWREKQGFQNSVDEVCPLDEVPMQKMKEQAQKEWREKKHAEYKMCAIQYRPAADIMVVKRQAQQEWKDKQAQEAELQQLRKQKAIEELRLQKLGQLLDKEWVHVGVDGWEDVSEEEDGGEDEDVSENQDVGEKEEETLDEDSVNEGINGYW